MHAKYNTCAHSAQVTRIVGKSKLPDYNTLKASSVVLSEVLYRLGHRNWSDVRGCCDAIATVRCIDCGEVHTVPSHTCKHRLCPLCQQRRSRRLAAQALDAVKLMRGTKALEGAQMWLLTLTQRNCPRGCLGDEIDALLESLRRMRHTRDMRRYVIGSARNIEITYNAEAQSWHPHIHMILIMRDAPDRMQSSAYWSHLWSTLMMLPYSPIVDMRPVRDDAAVFEVSKYVTKSMAILDQVQAPMIDHLVDELVHSLHMRMLVAYTGVWRDARRKLNQIDPDVEPEDKDHIDSLCGCGGTLLHSVMLWSGSEYVDSVDGDLQIADASLPDA